MNSTERAALSHLYESRFAALGRDVRALGWKNSADQRLRFGVLCDIGDLRGASICDVGCGFGDLIPYLNGRFGNFSYTGVDITPSFIVEASRLYPEHCFVCSDIQDFAPDNEFDYFLLSGALNWRVQNNWSMTTAVIRLLFERCRKGVALNVLTSYVNFEHPANYHHSPERLFTFARQLTPWVTLRHDYRLWEFTIYLLREPTGREIPDGCAHPVRD
jgi:ubiquinone/menaquinone biosynthesis C-methylase UbiE